MVSIFGLKIGGERKKKPDLPSAKPVRQQSRETNQDAPGAAKFNSVNRNQGNPYAAVIRSIPAPNATTQSGFLTPKPHALEAFYDPTSPTSASASMQNLSRTPSSGDKGFPTLKPAISNPTLGMRWNGSSPNLATPPETLARPATANPTSASARQRPWVAPLDVTLDNGHSPAPIIKSPLRQPQQIPGEDSAVPDTNESQPLPKALNIIKSSPPAIPTRSALRKPPSPPPSIKTASEKASSEIDRMSFLEKPIVPIAAAADGRPSSRGSHRNMPTSLRELMAADDFLPESPMSIPTPPPSLPRASNENNNRASMNEWGEPVIQTVRAKRETMTISPARRRSLEKLIDELDISKLVDTERRPRTSSGPRPLKLDTRSCTPDRQGPNSAPFAPTQRSESPFVRSPLKLESRSCTPVEQASSSASFGTRERSESPFHRSPLTLDTRSCGPDRQAPKSAPYAVIQRSESPFNQTPPRRARTGVPAAAVGARGRPMRPNREGIRRPTANEYGIAPEKPLDSMTRYQSPERYQSPVRYQSPDRYRSPERYPSPERCESPNSIGSAPDSPIMPTAGPLASAESPPDSPIMPSAGPLANPTSPPDSPIMPANGPLSSLASPPDSPIIPMSGPLSNSASPPDSPIIPMSGPLSNSASPPDSPIMPISGPLASPTFRAVSPIMPIGGPLTSNAIMRSTTTPEPRRDRLDTSFRFPDWSVPAESRWSPGKSVMQSPQISEITAAESMEWPLPAPAIFVPGPRCESPSMPARAQSPFAIPSFSRPWTPTNMRPGTPVKMTELAAPSGLRGAAPPARGPPPRIVPEYALRNTADHRDHSGQVFI